jgi:hypothetical protein
VWTEPQGLKFVADHAACAAANNVHAALSASGQYMMWFENAADHDAFSSASAADLVVGPVGLSSRTVVATGLSGDDKASFVGDLLVVSKADGAWGPYRVSIHVAPDWAGKVVAEDASPGFDVDAHGTVLSVVVSGGIRIVPLNGDPPVQLAADAAEAGLLSDGSAVYYRTWSSDLFRAPISGGPPNELQHGDVMELVRKSHDDQVLAYRKAYDGQYALLSLVTGDKIADLSATSWVYADRFSFTEDSRFVLYTDASGAYYAAPTSGGSVANLSPGEFTVALANLGLSRIVLSKNTGLRFYDLGAGYSPYAALESGFVLLCSQAPELCLMAGGSKIVFGTSEGLRVAEVP